MEWQITMYHIKPIEWKQSDMAANWFSARTGFGTLCVRSRGQWEWEVALLGDTEFIGGPCESIEDGKAKAEAYFFERLMTVLEPCGGQL